MMARWEFVHRIGVGTAGGLVVGLFGLICLPFFIVETPLALRWGIFSGTPLWGLQLARLALLAKSIARLIIQ